VKIFLVSGCSYSYGAGLYYHEWLKDKPEGYQIPHQHDSWVKHSEMISSSDHKFRRDNRYVSLLSKELGMDYIGANDVGGNNTNILLWGVEDALRRIKKIRKDKVTDKDVEFLLIQLTDPTRDYNRPNRDELRAWSEYKTFKEHWNEHLNNLVEKIDTLSEECKELNVKFYVFSMASDIGQKLINKDYFIPILFDNEEYNSIDDLKVKRNSSIDNQGSNVWIQPTQNMGKDINVPLLMCDELHQYGITDTHLGINGHKIVKDSIIRKLEEK